MPNAGKTWAVTESFEDGPLPTEEVHDAVHLILCGMVLMSTH